MSVDNEQERPADNSSAQQTNGQPSVTPEASTNPAVARFRKGFYTDSQYGLLGALGEEPEEYQQMMESLLEDLQPREGLETQLVEELAQSFWRMRRARRMQDGLALKRIQGRVDSEQMVASAQASRAFEILEPFQALKKALAPRGEGPTADEIEAFVKSRKGGDSERMQEFILLLQSLKGPMEERERRAARRKARTELSRLTECYESVAWRFSRKSEKVRSAENLAALMAPDDKNSMFLQRMEDSNLRRLWRLTNTLAKVRQGAFNKKMLKDDVQSRNVYENKQNTDRMPDEKSDICVDTTRILQKSAA